MRKPAHFLALVALLCLIGGIAGVVRSFYAMNAWDPVNARVYNNQIVPFTAGKHTRYRGEVIFRYISGEQRVQAPYSVPISYTTYDGARDDLLRFRVGAPITILVNRLDPYDFYVDRRESSRTFLLPGAAIAIGVIIGLISMMLFISAGKCLCPDCATSVGLHHRYCFSCSRKLPRRKKLVRNQ